MKGTKTMETKEQLKIQNVTYQVSGHIHDSVRSELQSIAEQLYDHLRSWTYGSYEEAEAVMNRRLEYLLDNNYHPETAKAVRENVMFIPTPEGG
jgi:ElaB/YqjD/DUF883 family membrane-anchored ribosome-binding protein